ncbi:MAG TPA: hypothetical protein VLA37_07350, partial [Sphingomonadaceae bacterium]|nr:hypothetical protein [Sphingomonadaceae bacterium]
LWWSERQEARLEEASETLVLAIEDITRGQPDSAYSALGPLAESGNDGARIVALMTRAGIAVESNRLEEAANIYAQVSADEGAPPLYRDLAIIREVTLRYDELGPDEVEARLKPLAVPGAPWFGSAGELLGHAYLDQGKDEQAGALFRTIATDENVPQSVRFRVRQMAGSMGVDAIEDVEETLGELSEAGDAQGAP